MKIRAALVLFPLLLALPFSPAFSKIREPQTVWTKSYDENVRWMGLVGDQLMLRGEHGILSVNPANGNVLWVRGSEAPVEFIERCKGHAFLRDDNQTLTKLKMADGTEQWRIQAFPNSRLFACSDTTVFGYSDLGVGALDLATGNRVWTKGVPSTTARPGYVPGRIYVMDEIAVRVLDEFSGKELRSANLLPPKYVMDPSASLDSFVAVYETKVAAFSASTFKPIWEYGMRQAVSANPKTDSANIFVPIQPGSLLALGLKDGAKKWEFITGTPIFYSPEVTSDAVYVAGDNGYVFAMELNGEELWRQAYGPLVAAPVFFQDTLYLFTQSGVLIAVKDVAKGEDKAPAPPKTPKKSK